MCIPSRRHEIQPAGAATSTRPWLRVGSNELTRSFFQEHTASELADP